MPRYRSDVYMAFPWGLNVTVQSVGIMEHTWNNNTMADTLSAYVRGPTSVAFICSPEASHDAHKGCPS